MSSDRWTALEPPARVPPPVPVRGTLWHTTELVKLEPGDIIVLDNFIMQHGRLSYTGERLHHAALIRDALG